MRTPDADGRSTGEIRHDRYDDDISDELFDYLAWTEERQLWEAWTHENVR